MIWSQQLTNDFCVSSYMKQQLYTIWIKESTPISHHIDEFITIIHKSRSRGLGFIHNFVVFIISFRTLRWYNVIWI